MGEVGGAKMVGALMLADELAAQTTDPARRPIVLISFETGGVRLHEANAGYWPTPSVWTCCKPCAVASRSWR